MGRWEEEQEEEEGRRGRDREGTTGRSTPGEKKANIHRLERGAEGWRGRVTQHKVEKCGAKREGAAWRAAGSFTGGRVIRKGNVESQ